VRAAIDKLPEMQRLVITMRDLEGLSSEEVRSALEISETNQRVLLHRARSKVRAALDEYVHDDA
jgi:RNA polymerase sigma-70 factor, ECF subfamily